MKKKLIIVVADGRVETIFADEELEVEIVDFDGTFDPDELESLGDYVDKLRDSSDLTEILVGGWHIKHTVAEDRKSKLL